MVGSDIARSSHGNFAHSGKSSMNSPMDGNVNGASRFLRFRRFRCHGAGLSRALFAVAIALAGCSNTPGKVEAAKHPPTDASVADASATDASLPDASTTNAGSGDAGAFTFATTTLTGTVKLPSGVTTPPSSLTVQSGLAHGAVSPAGAFSVTGASPGAQLVVVLDTSQNPMLMGWIYPGHTVIDAESTAEALLWFAAGAPLFPLDAKLQAITTLPDVQGLETVTSAIGTSLSANPDALASSNPALHAAMAQLLAAFNLGDAGAPIADLLLVTPGANSPQSGISVTDVETPPPDDPPFTAHVVNKYRRRAWAFVQRVSYTQADAGAPIPASADIIDFEVPPINGLNMGFTGAFTNIFNWWYGTSNSAYTPINAPQDPNSNATLPFSIPLVAGSSKTTYQVTVVGPGSSDGAAFANLTPAQSKQFVYICVNGLAQDVLVPFVANIIFGNSIAGTGKKFTSGATSVPQTFWINVAKNVTKDIIAKLPKLVPAITNYQWNDVLATLTKDPATSGTMRGIISDAITAVINLGTNFETWKLAESFNLVKSANTIISAMGFGMQVFDTSEILAERFVDHHADSWTLDVIPSRVALNPPSSRIEVADTQLLTATVQGVSDPINYSFRWTNTENGGDLLQVGAGAQTTSQGNPSFCASSQQVNYLAATSNTTDTVTVEVWNNSNCENGKGTSLGKANATIRVLSPEAGIGCGAPSMVVTIDGLANSIDYYSAGTSNGFYELNWDGVQFTAPNQKTLLTGSATFDAILQIYTLPPSETGHYFSASTNGNLLANGGGIAWNGSSPGTYDCSDRAGVDYQVDSGFLLANYVDGGPFSAGTFYAPDGSCGGSSCTVTITEGGSNAPGVITSGTFSGTFCVSAGYKVETVGSGPTQAVLNPNPNAGRSVQVTGKFTGFAGCAP